MTIDVTIVVGARGRILVNPNPVRVPSGRIEEIRWTILASPGWRFIGGTAGIEIRGRKAADTFVKPLRAGKGRQLSVIDLNSHPGTTRGGKRKKPKMRSFEYDIHLERVGPNGRVIDTANLDPTIENQGC